VQPAVSGADPSTASRRRLGPEQGEVEHRVPPQRDVTRLGCLCRITHADTALPQCMAADT
jgi:hypothetical protein